MATVVEDVIEGHSLTLDKDGFHISRVFHVSGIAGNAPARLYTAINTAGVPQRGDYHPDIPGIRAETISASPLDTSSVTVTVNYSSFRIEVQPPNAGTPPSIQVGSAVTETETNRDVDGNDLTVSHTYSDKTDSNGNPLVDTQPGFVSVQRPQTILRLTRKENTAPYDKSMSHVGKVNLTTFLGDPARYWLCTRIEGDSDDGGVTYTVTYEFQRNANTWDATVVYIVPETDKPHPEQGEEDEATFIVYESADFSGLNLGSI